MYQFPKRYVMKKLPKIGLNKFCKCVLWSRIFVGEAFERIGSIKMAEKLSTIGATTLSTMTHSIMTHCILTLSIMIKRNTQNNDTQHYGRALLCRM